MNSERTFCEGESRGRVTMFGMECGRCSTREASWRQCGRHVTTNPMSDLPKEKGLVRSLRPTRTPRPVCSSVTWRDGRSPGLRVNVWRGLPGLPVALIAFDSPHTVAGAATASDVSIPCSLFIPGTGNHLRRRHDRKKTSALSRKSRNSGLVERGPAAHWYHEGRRKVCSRGESSPRIESYSFVRDFFPFGGSP